MSDLVSPADYIRKECLGTGGFGSVNKILRRSDESVYAEKVIKLKNFGSLRGGNARQAMSLTSAQKEVALLHQLTHPNIVRVFTSFCDEQSGSFIIIMEYCEEGDLSGAIDERSADHSPFAEKQIRLWLHCLSHAIHYLHGKKIIHRDIKPKNIFLSFDRNSAKLGDFGIAKVLDECEPVCNSSVGTPSYLAPEIFQGSYSFPVDVWMLGVVLYELVTFRMPFRGNRFDLPRLIMTQPHQPIPDGECSKALLKLIDKMLLKNPLERPTIQQVLDDPFLTAVSASSSRDDLGLSAIKRSPYLSANDKQSVVDFMQEQQISGPALMEMSSREISRRFPSSLAPAVSSMVKREKEQQSSKSSRSVADGKMSYPTTGTSKSSKRRANTEMIKKSGIPTSYREIILEKAEEHDMDFEDMSQLSDRALERLFPNVNIRDSIKKFFQEMQKPAETSRRAEVSNEISSDAIRRTPGHGWNSRDLAHASTDVQRRPRVRPEPEPDDLKNDNRLRSEVLSANADINDLLLQLIGGRRRQAPPQLSASQDSTGYTTVNQF